MLEKIVCLTFVSDSKITSVLDLLGSMGKFPQHVNNMSVDCNGTTQ